MFYIDNCEAFGGPLNGSRRINYETVGGGGFRERASRKNSSPEGEACVMR